MPIQMRRVLKPKLAHPLAEVRSAPAGPNNAEDQGNSRPRKLIVFCFMRHRAAFIGLNRAPMCAEISKHFMFEPQSDSEKSLQRGSLSLYGWAEIGNICKINQSSGVTDLILERVSITILSEFAAVSSWTVHIPIIS